MSDALNTTWASHADLTRHERALIQDMSYGVLRHLGQLDGLLQALAIKPIHDRELAILLWIALYQLIHTRAASHAVVDSAVKSCSLHSAKGLVNGVLRQFLRRKQPLLEAVNHTETGRFSFPQWWIDRLKQQYPSRYVDILQVCNRHAPLTLRVNRRQLSRDDYLAWLTQQNIAAAPVGIDGIILDKPRPVDSIPGFNEGMVSVQDLGAQYAAALLDLKDGMRVLDACAAPGGKTAHILETAAVQLTALDIDSERLRDVRDNLQRLKLHAELKLGDACQTAQWWDRTSYQRILADVPCSASGVVRRHPDSKWLRRASDIAAYTAQQRAILEALWPLLEANGKLLYVTCSLFNEENEQSVQAFCKDHTDAVRISLQFADANRGQLLPSDSETEHNHDGFYYALIQKSQ